MHRRYRVPAVARAVQVLELLSISPQGMSLAQLAREIKIPKSSLFRILQTLQQNSLVIEDPERKIFTLGLKLLEWGNAALSKVDLKTIAHPRLINLAYETKESFYLTVLDDGEVIVIDHVDTPEIWKLVTRLGHRSPIHCTSSGLTLIAHLPEKALESLVERHGLQKFTPKTIPTLSKLKKRLEEIRQQGYAITDGEYKPELCTVAVPIWDHNGNVAASIMTAIPSDRVSRNKSLIGSLAEVIKKDAAFLSKSIGYKERANSK